MPKPGEPLHQVGALPIRRDASGVPSILLVTSRESRRWTIPKGWPMKGLKDYKAAAVEALEEAGVEGKVAKEPIGSYHYWKRQEAHFDLCCVEVYPLEVSKQLDSWPEASERERRWFAVDEAAHLVVEPELISLVASMTDEKPGGKARSGEAGKHRKSRHKAAARA